MPTIDLCAGCALIRLPAVVRLQPRTELPPSMRSSEYQFSTRSAGIDLADTMQLDLAGERVLTNAKPRSCNSVDQLIR